MPNTTVPAAATGLPTPHPRLVELIQRKKLRRKVESAVSRLIAVLDEIDADADAEPSLGFYQGTAAEATLRARMSTAATS